jgi:nitrous oxidase accessory protein
LLLGICTVAFSNTILVGNNQPLRSLRKAIEAAKDKDSIVLQTGIYKEGALVITKSITLLGQGISETRVILL